MSDTITACFTTLAELAERRAEWLALMARAVEPNPFYGPDYLIASEGHLHPRRPIRMLIVERAGVLAGLFPLERPIVSDLLFGRAWRLYRNPYTCLGTPLIDADAPESIVAAALACLARQGGPRQLIAPLLPLDGPVAHHLSRHAAATHLAIGIAQAGTRAALVNDMPPDSYRKMHWSKSRRNKLRRLRERAAALGVIGLERVTADQPRFQTFLEGFLALEAKGWKGKAGTALAAREATRAFACGAFGRAEPGASSAILALTLDGTPIAMALLLVAGRTGYTVKVAYDEAFADLGPGRLLDADMLDLVGPDAPFGQIDSCALPGNPVEDLWAARIRIGMTIMALAPQNSPFGVNFAGWWMEKLQQIRALRHPRGFTTRG